MGGRRGERLPQQLPSQPGITTFLTGTEGSHFTVRYRDALGLLAPSGCFDFDMWQYEKCFPKAENLKITVMFRPSDTNSANLRTLSLE